MRRPATNNPEMLAKCRELYIKYNGGAHREIEREMRAVGFPKFYRQLLYNARGGIGWIESNGWENLITKERRKTAAEKRCVTEFEKWLKATEPKWTWDWPHQQIINDALQRITDGETKRLMIFLPPRHGKSELVTVRYSAWRLMRDPSLNIILGSYNQKLANRFSRKIRNALVTAQSQPPQASAGLSEPPASAGRLSEPPASAGGASAGVRAARVVGPPDTSSGSDLARMRPANSAAEWETTAGGGLRAVGVGGGVTGFGAGLIMIDDPIKSRAEAESKTFRDKI
jgi:hypothetical protein